MFQDIRQAMHRSSRTLWRDLLGVTALGVAFYSLLHMPSLLTV